MGRLNVSRASAGTGKTYSICEAIVARVRDGLDPARILATTFTVKAAAELKGRIQARLLGEKTLPLPERIERSERLELACLGTVDSVAKQLLERFALELGISPEVRVVEEESSERYLRRILRELPADEWREFTVRAERLSLIDSRNRTRDASRLLLALLRVRRENQIGDAPFAADMQRSVDELCTMLAPDGPDDSLPGIAELRRLISEALTLLPVAGDTTTTSTPNAIAKLRRQYPSNPPWEMFATCATIKAAKASNDALNSLRDYATTARYQPALHDDLRTFMRLATELTVQLSDRYTSFKRERGVYDFTDLEVEVDRLLHHPSLGPRVAAEFDFVVVDEFQDTSPLQLAIFARLRDMIDDNYWVGDEKQAIYGFRGADARLMRRVWTAAEGDAKSDSSEVQIHHLEKNFRSREGLVEFVNETFAPVLGETVKVTAARTPTSDDPDCGTLERWGYAGKGVKVVEPKFVAAGVSQWLRNGTRPGSVAVLARKKKHVYAIADELAALGIPAVVERPGLLKTRECQIAVAGLRLVADLTDGLAAATILHLIEVHGPDLADRTPSWFGERLSQMANRNGGRLAAFADNPTLAPLHAVHERSAISSPAECLIEVIAALALTGEVARWGEASKRASHLDALVAHTHTYQAECANAARPATISGLVAHLEDLATNEEDYLPSTGGVDAVTVCTYHAAKGLEWEQVVLTQLDDDHQTDLWTPVADGETDPHDPLRHRRLTYWPWPFGSSYGKIRKGSGLELAAFASERGVGIEREQSAESLRLLYVGITRARDCCALVTKIGGKVPWLDRVPDIDRLLPASGPSGDVEIAEVSARVRRVELVTAAVDTDRPTSTRWLDTSARDNDNRATTAAFHSPSTLAHTAPTADAPSIDPTRFEAHQLPGDKIDFPRVDRALADRLGNAVHQFLGALPSMSGADSNVRTTAARHALETWGFDEIDADSLVEAGRRFEVWIGDRYPGATWLTELPVTAPRGATADDGQWNGFLDLLLVLPGGVVVIIDHKSGVVLPSGIAAYAARYSEQISAYQAILEHDGINVVERWLHLPLSGDMIAVHD